MRTAPLLVTCLCLVAACSVNLDLPAGTPIACTGDSNCPDGLTCDAAAGRCVGPEAVVDVVPQSVVISAQTVGSGEMLTVQFDVTGELLDDPTVTIEAGNGLPMTLVSSQGLTYQFSYTTTGSEPEGAAAITAELVSSSGSNSVTVGTVTFDFP